MQQSAGYAIIDNERKAVLCVRAYAKWDFPKGHLEAEETHRDAAIREVMEEVSLMNGEDYVDIGTAPIAVTYGKGKSLKTATYFLADCVSEKEPFCPVNPELGKPENDEWRWVEFEDLPGMMPERLQPVVDRILDWVGYQ